jgi:hypothetical protein
MISSAITEEARKRDEIMQERFVEESFLIEWLLVPCMEDSHVLENVSFLRNTVILELKRQSRDEKQDYVIAKIYR